MSSMFDLGYELVVESISEEIKQIKVNSKQGKEIMKSIFKKDPSTHDGIIVINSLTGYPYFMVGVKGTNKRVIYYAPQIPRRIKTIADNVFSKIKSIPEKELTLALIVQQMNLSDMMRQQQELIHHLHHQNVIDQIMFR